MQTKRFLFAWELGGSLGHLARLRPLAQMLAEQGHRVDFAVRNLGGLAALPAEHAVFAAPAPARSRVCDAIREPASFADILYNDGITVPGELAGVARAWRSLLEQLQPSLVVGDFSPYVLLAGQGLDIPQALLGTGFACPPDCPELPDLRAWQMHYPERIRATEQDVLAAINRQLEAQKAAPVEGVGALYARSEANFLATFAELDHYPQRQQSARPAADYRGVWSELGGKAPRWPAGNGKRVFAYLKPFRGLVRLLSHMENSGASVIVFSSAEIDPGRWSKGNLRIVREPVDMNAVVPTADLILCHAGHGTSAFALLSGTPLLLMPFQVEQYHTGENIARMGAGLSVKPEEMSAMLVAYDRLLAEPEFKASAAAWSTRHSSFSSDEALATIMADLLELSA